MSDDSIAPTITAIVLAAGKGERAGGSVAKQLLPLADKPVLRWSVERFADDPRVAQVIVVAGHDTRHEIGAALAGLDRITIVAGGPTRRASVGNGLAIATYPVVMVHDAARPIVPVAVIDRLVAALSQSGVDGVTPSLPVVDTLARRDGDHIGGIVDRDTLLRIQTPQIFHAETLVNAHREWTGAEPTDDAQMVRRVGGTVVSVTGDDILDKITYPGDLGRMEALMGAKTRIATGMGYDVHRLVSGEELWLGGIKIEHDKGLSGHSDADVALHALTDAILGAIGAGDIGTHFPPSDPQWRGARSDRFLAHAARLMRRAGGNLQSLDVTIVCEAPKIGPHRAAMQSRIAEILAVDSERVSVKATTTEGLGFTGRKEGIAAQAIATVKLVEG